MTETYYTIRQVAERHNVAYQTIWGMVKSGELEAPVNNVNQPPAITGIVATPLLVPLGTSVTLTGSFTDPDAGDMHSATWQWGDQSQPAAGDVTEPDGGAGQATGSHLYTRPGVYEVNLQVTDASGAQVSLSYQYVVVYDPTGGFVTGGGWITSPLGAYTADPALTGKATFGFEAKYAKGANVPSGNTVFQFNVANLNFKSTGYDWLAVAGSKAQFKGTGTINGHGTFGFMLSAVDGDQLGKGKPDLFRIKIWDSNGVIYDNKMGAADTDDPTTALGGGSIVIHK